MRWQEAIDKGKGKLKPLDASIDLETILSIHLKRTARKDGIIMFMGKKWSEGCPDGTELILCLIPSVKFMVYKGDKKIWEFHL